MVAPECCLLPAITTERTAVRPNPLDHTIHPGGAQASAINFRRGADINRAIPKVHMQGRGGIRECFLNLARTAVFTPWFSPFISEWFQAQPFTQ